MISSYIERMTQIYHLFWVHSHALCSGAYPLLVEDVTLIHYPFRYYQKSYFYQQPEFVGQRVTQNTLMSSRHVDRHEKSYTIIIYVEDNLPKEVKVNLVNSVKSLFFTKLFYIFVVLAFGILNLSQIYISRNSIIFKFWNSMVQAC